MPKLTPNSNSAPVDLYQSLAQAASGSAQQGGQNLGSMITGADGREFRWVLAGASNLVAGDLQQSPAIVANHQNMASTTQAIGDTQITVTLGNTAATANQYAGGYVFVNAGTGKGLTYQIASHPAANASATLVLTLADPIVVATLTSDTKTSLYPNPYNGVIINPTTPTGVAVGVAPWALTTATYGWIQVHGITAGLSDAGIYAAEQEIAPSTLTAGAFGSTVSQTTTDGVGFAVQAGVSAEYRAVYLNL